jgi:hypothetical protein
MKMKARIYRTIFTVIPLASLLCLIGSQKLLSDEKGTNQPAAQDDAVNFVGFSGPSNYLNLKLTAKDGKTYQSRFEIVSNSRLEGFRGSVHFLVAPGNGIIIPSSCLDPILSAGLVAHPGTKAPKAEGVAAQIRILDTNVFKVVAGTNLMYSTFVGKYISMRDKSAFHDMKRSS